MTLRHIALVDTKPLFVGRNLSIGGHERKAESSFIAEQLADS